MARTPLTDLEIGYSARNAGEWDRLLGAVSAFRLVEIEPRDFVRALQIQRLLADRGLRGRKVPDLLIAAAAESRSLTLLHYEADYDHVAAVTGQRTEWVADRGSID